MTLGLKTPGAAGFSGRTSSYAPESLDPFGERLQLDAFPCQENLKSGMIVSRALLEHLGYVDEFPTSLVLITNSHSKVEVQVSGWVENLPQGWDFVISESAESELRQAELDAAHSFDTARILL